MRDTFGETRAALVNRRTAITCLIVASATLMMPSSAYANPASPPAWPYLTGLSTAVLIAVVVETAVAAAFRIRGRTLLAIAALNLVTNPVMNVLWLASTTRPADLFFMLEMGVIVLEFLVLLALVKRPPWTPIRLLGLSLLMNVTSFFIGAAVTGVLPGYLLSLT